jgi:transposase-like protein
VHLVRHSLNFCGWKDRKNVAKDLKRVYQATDDVEAEKALADFEGAMGREIPLNRPKLAAGMAGSDPVFRLPASGPQNHLHHQRDRNPQSAHPQNHQNARQLPNRRCRDKADLPGNPQF